MAAESQGATLMTVCYVTAGGDPWLATGVGGEGAWKQCHVLGPRHASPLRASLKPRRHALPPSHYQYSARQPPPRALPWRRLMTPACCDIWRREHRAAGLPCASSTTVLFTPRRTRVVECGRACGGILADVVTRAVTPEVAGVGVSKVKERLGKSKEGFPSGTHHQQLTDGYQ